MSEILFRNKIGLSLVSFIIIGMMIGGGIFVYSGIVFKITGQALPLAYGVAVIPVFISMMPLALLGATIPSTGANYIYPSRLVSPGLAFIGIWVYALASFFGQIPLYVLACGQYASAIFPSISPKIFAIVVVTVFFVINLFGLKIAAKIQAVLVITLLIALLIYGFSGISQLNTSNFNNLFEEGSGSFLLGIALLTFTFFGANGIIEIGGEIKNPGRVIPRAFYIAFPLVAFIYVLVSVSTVGSVSKDILTGSEEPLVTAAESILGRSALIFFIFGGAIIALLTTLNSLFILGTRSLLMIVKDKLLPENLGKMNEKFNSPYIMLTAIWILSLAGILSGLSLKTFASYAALGGLIIFLPVLIAALKFPKLYPEKYKKSQFKLSPFWLWFCSLTGIIMVIFFGIILLYDLDSVVNTGLFIGFFLSGMIFYYFRTRYLKSKGINIKKLIHRDF